MSSALRIVVLGIACLILTGVSLMIMNSIMALFAPCYLAGGCPKMPMTEAIASVMDAIRYICYFAIFPAGAIIRRRDFRKLTSSRRFNRVIRYTFAALPLLLLPFRSLFNVNLF